MSDIKKKFSCENENKNLLNPKQNEKEINSNIIGINLNNQELKNKIPDFIINKKNLIKNQTYQNNLSLIKENENNFLSKIIIGNKNFITKKDFNWAVDVATKKKKLDCSSAEFITINEGLCVQIMHIGSYDDEPASVALMNDYLATNGYTTDITATRLHHEIYLSDARKVPREKLKTVIRHPIRKA